MTTENCMERRERDYQNKIVDLFRQNLSYAYLGSLQYPKGMQAHESGEKNSPFIEKELYAFLSSRLTPSGARLYTDYQVDIVLEKVRAETRLSSNHPGALIEQNAKLYESLARGVKARPSPDENEVDVMLFDFRNPQANRFALAEEVSFIDVLTGSHSRPDLVVYVNGFALAVIELKRSLVSIDEAIKQQLSNQCDLIPSFFTTVQFSVAASDTNGFQYATIKTPQKFWCAYKRDTNETGVQLTDREAFAEFFEKKHFIDFFRYGILLDGGIKKVMRPHQFHALRAAIPRMCKKESGVIWHSQGSGKSLTMIWLAAYIRANFTNPRILIITDRTELDAQIKLNFNRAGDDIYQATSQYNLLAALQGTLDTKNAKSSQPWLICSLIHKFGHHASSDKDNSVPIELDKYLKELKEVIKAQFGANFKAKGDNIFVFIDECHRTQGGRLHEAMREIMGQDVMLIGFTGTPLLKKDKNKSADFGEIKDLSEVKFGSYIHKYLHKQAVEDKVILDLQYEARDVEQEITDKDKLDAKKKEITQGLDEIQTQAVEDRWANLERVYSSKDRIERIGFSILDDISKYPLSEPWCNAMLVAGSIEAAYKYFEFFQITSPDTSLKGRCAVVTSYEPSDDDLRKKTSDPNIEASIKFKYAMAKTAFEIEGVTNGEAYEKIVKKRFIDSPGRLKLMIVVDKLLTGFDAPCATYLYIDKDMRDHNLFQAICRVNRLGVDVKGEGNSVIKTHKEWGRIIDFKQLFKKITDAVTAFNDENGAFGGFDAADVEGLLSEFVEKGKRKLVSAIEAYDALKASWQNRTRDELLEFYVTDTPELTAKEQRQALYKITSALVVAYSNLSDYLGKAGYSSEESEEIRKKASEARTIHLLVEQKSGDYFDPHSKDPQMRALFDRFIKAGEADIVVPATADFSFLDLIDDTRDPDDAVGKTTKASGGNAGAAAEIIEGKVRSVINSWHEKDPKAYNTFSERLQALLDEMRKEALDYRQKMLRLIALLKEVKSGGTNFPSGITSKLAKALWNNREKWCPVTDEEEQAQTVRVVADLAINDAPADFWLNPASEAMFRRSLCQAVPTLKGEQLGELMPLIVQNL